MSTSESLSNSTIPPSLTHLATLISPSGRGTRAWQSKAHPSLSIPLLATASSDKSVNVWSLRDFRLLSTISGGHKRSVRCVEWKDYGHTPQSSTQKQPVTLATGSFDANVGIWVHNDRSDKTQRLGLSGGVIGGEDELLHDGDEPMTTGTGDDGDEIDIAQQEAEGDEDEEWHFSTLLTGPDSEIKSIAFAPPHYSANLLATSSRDKSVWVWEEVEDEEWETIAVLSDHTGDVKCVAWCEGARSRRTDSQDDGEEGRVVGCRQVLASGSYDDTIRLWRDVEEEGDWACVGVIDGHKGTVWDVCWEGYLNPDFITTEREENEWEPRIITCSDDLSVRTWRRELSEMELEKKRNNANVDNATTGAGPRMPSSIRPPSNHEKWVPDAEFPNVHLRSVYAVDWSRETGLVTSCGGDGTIAVYKEVAISAPSSDSNHAGDEDTTMTNGDSGSSSDTRKQTKWIVVALLEAAHDEYEVNHVCWAKRRDQGKRFEGEEVLVSTADDGDVRVWELPEELVRR